MFSMILNCFGPWLKVLNDYFWDYITGVYISEYREIILPKRLISFFKIARLLKALLYFKMHLIINSMWKWEVIKLIYPPNMFLQSLAKNKHGFESHV